MSHPLSCDCLLCQRDHDGEWWHRATPEELRDHEKALAQWNSQDEWREHDDLRCWNAKSPHDACIYCRQEFRDWVPMWGYPQETYDPLLRSQDKEIQAQNRHLWARFCWEKDFETQKERSKRERGSL